MLSHSKKANTLLNLICTQLEVNRHISTTTKLCNNRGQLIINCKRQQYNFYSGDYYNKLDEVPLASKGWTHSKSKGDYFIIRPVDHSTQQLFSFRDIGLDSHLIKALKEQGIEKSTEFQAKAIPAIRRGEHILIAAETGCGKTITYLLPIIEQLKEHKTDLLNSPRAVILVPNRELAYQIAEVAQKLGAPFNLKVKCIVGGRTKKIMMNPEFEEMDILVGTPGALGKLTTVGIFKLSEVLFTVFDEADTLLDDSFIERMGMIVKKVSQSQLILVSATLPRALPAMLNLAEENLQEVISPNLHKPLLNVTQKFLRITRSIKPQYLLESIEKSKAPTLVFTNKNETCNWLAMYLREHNISCANINGDMNYAIRVQQWDDFVTGKARVLSATDIGSRGLNTIQVNHVLNYGFPLYAADYLHRIGRTGRFGSPKSCMVTNFITGPLEVKLVQQIEMAIRKRQALENVDGNITNIVQNKIMTKMKNAA